MNVTEIFIPAAVFAGIVAVLLKVILWQNEKRMDERFVALEEARTAAGKHWDARYGLTEKAMLDLTERMARVETNVRHMPTHQEVTIIREGIAKLAADNTTQTDTLRRLEQQLRLIHEWMLVNK